MPSKKPARPSRVCRECDHYYACSAHTFGLLHNTDATHCANFANVTANQQEIERLRLLLDEAELELAKAEPVPKWISVKDRLPEECTDVLVLCKWGDARWVRIADVERGKWLTNCTELDLATVTHWMPLPEAPVAPEPPGAPVAPKEAAP